MGDQPQHTAPLSKSRGTPGATVRAKGLSKALSPFIIVVFLAGWVFAAVVPPTLLEGPKVGALLIVLSFAMVGFWSRALKLTSRYEEGAQGEELVARALESLPDGWRIFHGVLMDGKIIDHVLVGPEHIYLVETIQWPGTISVKGGNLVHGRKAYGGYTLVGLRRRSETFASVMDLPVAAVSSLVCMVGGRFTQPSGDMEGVWLGELQDLLPYVQGHAGTGVSRSQRVAALDRLNDALDEGA